MISVRESASLCRGRSVAPIVSVTLLPLSFSLSFSLSLFLSVSLHLSLSLSLSPSLSLSLFSVYDLGRCVTDQGVLSVNGVCVCVCPGLCSVNGDVRFFEPRAPDSVNVLQTVKGLTALDIHPQANLFAW